MRLNEGGDEACAGCSDRVPEGTPRDLAGLMVAVLAWAISDSVVAGCMVAGKERRDAVRRG
jgi:hypothetical protein